MSCKTSAMSHSVVVNPRASPLGRLQDAPPYAHDAGPFIALALEEFETVELTFGPASVGL